MTNAETDLRAALRRAFLKPTNAIVGIVDELLTLCRQGDFHFEWHDVGHVRIFDRAGQLLFDEPFRKSVFRAILARFTALCNDNTPNSVTPYGGKGEVSVGLDPQSRFKVSFVNTTDAQVLQLTNVFTEPQAGNGSATTAEDSAVKIVG